MGYPKESERKVYLSFIYYKVTVKQKKERYLRHW